jgi:hypothetical protein
MYPKIAQISRARAPAALAFYRRAPKVVSLDSITLPTHNGTNYVAKTRTCAGRGGKKVGDADGVN